jgi:cell division protein FtsZ
MQGAKGVIISITGGDDMRLLEVDEAANHIRDLVDPDANIIWGSAFNPELEGKIRVSVVATGIDADARASTPIPAPETSRSFSFGMGRKTDEPVSFRPTEPTAPAAAPVAAPVEPAPQPAATAAVAEEPLDLTAGDAIEADAAPQAADASNEELVLGAETIVSQPPRTFTDEPFGKASPAALPAGEEGAGRRRWLSPGNEVPAAEAEPAAQPRVKLGGTLFERMSNAARGASRDDAEDDAKEPLDIPRFLHRQNNQ